MKEKKHLLLGITKKTLLYRTENFGTIKACYIKGITEEEEDYISNNRFYKTDSEIIESKNILLYGEVNLDDEEDLFNIERFNFASKNENSIIPSSFDYDENTCISIDNIVKYTPTTNSILWFKYNYCLIGKPKRIIVYEKQLKRNRYGELCR